MKGQEDAPFEILIGMIILGFVLSISSYVFEDYNKYQVEAKLELEMNNLANLIEGVYNQAPGSKLSESIDLSVPVQSGNIKIKYITFTNNVKMQECVKNTGLDNCWVIEVHAGDKWNSDYVIKKKYLKIPASVNINAQLMTKSKEYECDRDQTCLKMVRYFVNVIKESDNTLTIEFW